MTKRTSYPRKESHTKMSTIEKKYGKDFGVRSNKKLGNYLKEKGYGALNELLNAGNG